jgi:hypothetical protein
VTEESDDAFDRLFHAVEVCERRISADRTVQEDTAKARVLGRVDQFRLSDGGQQSLRGVGVSHWVASTRLQIIRHRHIDFAARLVGPRKRIKQSVVVHAILRLVGRPAVRGAVTLSY